MGFGGGIAYYPEIPREFCEKPVARRLYYANRRTIEYVEPIADVSRQEASSSLEKTFKGLAEQWQDATSTFSLNMRRYAHPTYQSLMHTLGKENIRDVVPLILGELLQRPDMWFEALKVLTKENPAQNAKTFDEAVRAWIDWGKREHYIP